MRMYRLLAIIIPLSEGDVGEKIYIVLTIIIIIVNNVTTGTAITLTRTDNAFSAGANKAPRLAVA